MASCAKENENDIKKSSNAHKQVIKKSVRLLSIKKVPFSTQTPFFP